MSAGTSIAIISLVLTALVGAVSIYFNVKSARSSRDSAAEAKRANRLASRPNVDIASDGTCKRGVEATLVSDSDLDELVVELHWPTVGWPDRDDLTPLRSIYMDRLTTSIDGVGTREVTLHDVRAGQVYWLSLMPMDHLREFARAEFRVTARCAGDEWVFPAGFERVELRFSY